jgi:hypothetical protein
MMNKAFYEDPFFNDDYYDRFENYIFKEFNDHMLHMMNHFNQLWNSFFLIKADNPQQIKSNVKSTNISHTNIAKTEPKADSNSAKTASKADPGKTKTEPNADPNITNPNVAKTESNIVKTDPNPEKADSNAIKANSNTKKTVPNTETAIPQEKYIYHSKYSSYSNSNGIAHTKYKVYNNIHGTKMTETRRIGDQGITWKREINKEGCIEDKEVTHNISENEKDKFMQEWEERSSKYFNHSLNHSDHIAIQ